MGIALVTGANRGIGLELCRQLQARGDTVIAACRKSSPELEALGCRVEAGVDVTSDTSLAALVEKVDGAQIDLLVNNAGIMSIDNLDALDWAGIRKQFEVNALGPLRVTAMLRPKLAEGAKVAIVTSRMGSIGDNTSGSMYGYRMSKAAVNMAGVSLAHDLKSDGIAVIILHPGMVKTDMTAGMGQIEPEKAVKGLLDRIHDLTLETTGQFWHAKGEQLPW